MLGIEIKRDRRTRTLSISQREYTDQVLKRFGMENSKAVATPMVKSSTRHNSPDNEPLPTEVPYRQAIGSLIYLVSCTRPDLAFTIRYLSQFLDKPQQQHWAAVKRVLRYLSGTRNYGIQYNGQNNLDSKVIG